MYTLIYIYIYTHINISSIVFNKILSISYVCNSTLYSRLIIF